MGTSAVAERTGTQDLVARLEQPETAELLNRLLDRLDIIVFATDAAQELLHRSDEITNSVAENIEELRKVPIPFRRPEIGGEAAATDANRVAGCRSRQQSCFWSGALLRLAGAPRRPENDYFSPRPAGPYRSGLFRSVVRR